MHIINISPSMAPSKAVTVLFFQSLPFHSSDSDELWSPAVLTKDKPHTPNHKQFGSLKQMVKEIPCINHKILQQLTGKKKKKELPFLSTKYISEQLRKAVLFTSRDFYDTGYFPIDSLVLQECFGLKDFLGQKNSWIWILNLTGYTVQTFLSGSTLVF